jgi:hypothetical protein
MGLSTGNIEEEDIDDVRRRTRRKQNGSGVRKAVSASSGRPSRRSSNRESGSGHEVFLSEPLLPNSDEHL